MSPSISQPAHLGPWPLLHPPSTAQLSASVEPGYMAPPVRAKRPCRRPPRPWGSDRDHKCSQKQKCGGYMIYIYIWYDIWYMINYVMIYDDLCLKLIKYDVIITYNQNLVRWDRWVMIVPRQIWWTLAVCSQAEHGTSTSTLQYPAPICHVHLIELQVTEDSFVPRTTFALGHLSNASQSMKFIEISWPVSHYRDLCGGIHMRLYTVVIL